MGAGKLSLPPKRDGSALSVNLWRFSVGAISSIFSISARAILIIRRFYRGAFVEERENRWSRQLLFSNDLKLSDVFPSPLVLEGMATGGYPQKDETVFGPHIPDFPIYDLEWSGAAEPCDVGAIFFRHRKRGFSPGAVRALSHVGDELIRDRKEINLALRSLQEQKMRGQRNLVDNAAQWLVRLPDVQKDVMHIRRIGAVPTYRGPTPTVERTRGLPHNPKDAQMMMGKLWEHVRSEKMVVCTQAGVHRNAMLPTSPSSTVA